MKKLFSSNKVYLAPSKIKKAGRGVFAAQDLKRGEIIEACPIILVPKYDLSNLKESVLVAYFFYFGKKKEYLALVLGFGSIYNHSYNPNAKYKIKQKLQTMDFTAIKDIKMGVEITFNYSFGNPKSKSPLWFEVTEGN